MAEEGVAPTQREIATQTSVTFADIQPTPMQTNRELPFALQNRLVHMWLCPDWAASDELDRYLDLVRPFTSDTLLPRLRWDQSTWQLSFASELNVDASFATVVYAIVMHQSHWFGMKIVRRAHGAQCAVYDDLPMEPTSWNAFLHQCAALLGIQPETFVAHFIPTRTPNGMCGYVALWCILQDCRALVTPDVEVLVLRFQNHPQAVLLVEIVNRAFESFVSFANAVRVVFMTDLLRRQNPGPYCVASGRGASRSLPMGQSRSNLEGLNQRGAHSTHGATVAQTRSNTTLSSLACRFGRFYGIRVGEASNPGPVTRKTLDPIVSVVARLREFRPVNEVCECHANNFAAMLLLGEKISDDESTVTISAQIVPHPHTFPELFRGVSLTLPSCSHVRTRQGALRMLHCVWESPDRSDVVWLMDAKILHFRHGFFVDTTDPKTAMVFQRSKSAHDREVVITGELFCGGFSGWTQAMKFFGDKVARTRSALAGCPLLKNAHKSAALRAMLLLVTRAPVSKR